MSAVWPARAAVATGRGAERLDLQALFAEHYDGVYRAAFRVLGTPDEAEDIAQETFVRLYRESTARAAPHNVRAWLYRVATNLALNAARARSRRELRDVGGGAPQEETVPTDPLAELERHDEIARVRRALLMLSERDARMLMLRHAGLSYREVAAALGVAPGSIGTMLARAEAAFESAYARRGGVDEEGVRDGL